MGRKILVTSGKGGVGKTTVVAGLARALASINATVCVVDGDIGLNNLDLLMGAENKVVYDIVDCMSGKCQIKQAIIKDSFLDNLFIMPAGKNWPSKQIFSFDCIVDKLASIFDFVVVDSPAGIDSGYSAASKPCREAIVVVTPHISSIRDASKMLSILSADNSKISVKIVVNRIRGDLVASGEMMSHRDISGLLNADLLGVLPESDRYNLSSSFDFAFGSKDELSAAFKILAQNIVDDKQVEFDYLSRYKGFAGLIRRRLKRL
ncbi:MAG: septum site-determining protein MinD [Clostridia bacterium]|nr:septum site-determining protein MinD [Clostridia bacterium]